MRVPKHIQTLTHDALRNRQRGFWILRITARPKPGFDLKAEISPARPMARSHLPLSIMASAAHRSMARAEAARPNPPEPAWLILFSL